VWVTNFPRDSVSRIDPHANRVIATIRVGQGPTGLVATDDAVWVVNHGDATVSRIEPRTGRVVAVLWLGGTPWN
jgi:YVTN family beta-propeller protein